VLGEAAQRLGYVSGNRWLLGDDECFSHAQMRRVFNGVPETDATCFSFGAPTLPKKAEMSKRVLGE
jgi:hypothetical protein